MRNNGNIAVTSPVEANIILVLNYASRREHVWGNEGISPRILTSALHEDEWLLYPRGYSPGINWTGGWVGPRVDLYTAEKKNLYPCRESKPDPSVV
jgi:hypothetical protein